MDQERRFLAAVALSAFILAGGFWFIVITAGQEHDPAPSRAASDLATASIASAMYREQFGRWPQQWSDLQDFLDRELRDPWSRREYVWFQRTGEPPIFMSWGADRLPGGVGLDADIVERSAFDARRDEIRELRRAAQSSPPRAETEE